MFSQGLSRFSAWCWTFLCWVGAFSPAPTKMKWTESKSVYMTVCLDRFSAVGSHSCWVSCLFVFVILGSWLHQPFHTYFVLFLVHKMKWEQKKTLAIVFRVIFNVVCCVFTVYKSSAFIREAQLENCALEETCRESTETQLDNNTVILLIIHNPNSWDHSTVPEIVVWKQNIQLQCQ